jgi:hypothetical protein
MKLKLTLLLSLFLLPLSAFGAVVVFDSNNVRLGNFTNLQCPVGMTCAQSSGRMVMTPNGYGLRPQVASTTVAITASQCGATFVSNSTDIMTLPEASTVLGCRLTFVCGTVDDFDINPADGTDQIGTVASVTGTNTTTVLAPAAGDAIRCTDIGSSIVLEAVGANLWVSLGTATGIWTDVN